MKVQQTKKINDSIVQHGLNVSLDQTICLNLTNPIVTQGFVIDDCDGLNAYADCLRTKMADSGISFSKDQSLVFAAILNISNFDPIMNIKDIPAPIIQKIIKNTHVFHLGELEENPYYRNIHFEDQKLGRFELSSNIFHKYELMLYDAGYVDNGIGIPAIGMTDYDFHFPCIKEDNNVWMSITPNEIYTMKKPIEKASGRVLTLGCGMGYFAYMAALKENVESVTIVEKEPEVIELFEKVILPQFSCKDKITVINADAFDFVENLKDGEYDFCFADIWRGVDDTVPYLRLKSLCGRFRQTFFSYWIEDSLIYALTAYVYVIIINAFRGIQTNTSDPVKLSDAELYKFNFLQNLLQDEEILRPEHLDYYMNHKSIICLMSNKNTTKSTIGGK